MDKNIQLDLRELIRAAEMSGINPQQIPGDANPSLGIARKPTRAEKTTVKAGSTHTIKSILPKKLTFQQKHPQ